MRLLRSGRPGRIVAVSAALTTVLSLVVVALVGAGAPPKGFTFRRDGHWVFVESLRAAFHVDGGARRADARTGEFDKGITDVASGRQAVVGVGPGVLDVVRGSDLVHDTRLTDSPAEMPAQLRAAEFSVLVYKEAGVVRRLTSLRPDSVTIGTPIGEAVAQPDGTVWVTGRDDGRICWVASAAVLPHCKGVLPSRSSRLVLVDGRPVAVDTRSDSAYGVTAKGLGKAVRLAVDLPDDAKLAPASTGGEIVALDGSSLLVAGVTRATATRAERIAVAGKGPFQVPHVNGPTVVLAPSGTGPVVTLNRDTGRVRSSSAPIPGAAVANEPDGHVYVDGSNGTTLVVDAGGAISDPIDLNEVRVPGPPKREKPKPSPKATPAPTLPVPQAPAPAPPVVAGPRKPIRPLAPRNVTGWPGNATVTVTWTAPVPNGAVVERYVIEAYDADVVRDGPPIATARASGPSRSAEVSGLRNGSNYVFWVSAVSAAGAGPRTRTGIVTPSADVPGAPGTPGVTSVPGTAANPGAARIVASWTAASGEGHEIAGYDVTLTADGFAVTRQAAAGARATAFTAADGLQYGVRYGVTVRARNDAGRVGPTAQSPAQALFWRAADAPVSLTARPSDGRIDLTWATPAVHGGRLLHYAVTRQDDGTTTEVTTEAASYTGLRNGTTYTFTVLARTDDGSGGGRLDGAAATAQAAPGRAPEVGQVSASLVGDRTVRVSFGVNRHDSGPAECRVSFDGALRWQGGCDSSVTVDVGGLEYRRTYTVTATASNGYGQGNETSTQVRTNDPPPRVEVSVGGYQGPCTIGSGECYYIVVRLFDFPAGPVAISCSDEDTPNWRTYTVQVGASGSHTSQQCSHARNGQAVWVTANGHESPHIRFQ